MPLCPALGRERTGVAGGPCLSVGPTIRVKSNRLRMVELRFRADLNLFRLDLRGLYVPAQFSLELLLAGFQSVLAHLLFLAHRFEVLVSVPSPVPPWFPLH